MRCKSSRSRPIRCRLSTGAPGAVVNMVHRSGGSEFHGVLYEFLRNNVFDANGFFNKLNGRSKAAFRYNQFGATAGGPLPRSRQTTFFFFNYEGIRQVNPGEQTFSVPTAAMRQGDFSAISGTIYDPATIDAAGERRPFAGNRIPASRIDLVGAKMASFYPSANRAGLVNNFFSQAGSRTRRNNVSTKIDRRISDKQNLFGRFSWRARRRTRRITTATRPPRRRDSRAPATRAARSMTRICSKAGCCTATTAIRITRIRADRWRTRSRRANLVSPPPCKRSHSFRSSQRFR